MANRKYNDLLDQIYHDDNFYGRTLRYFLAKYWVAMTPFWDLINKFEETNKRKATSQDHETFYQDSKPDETKFTNEINGVKVYTCVIISTYFKTVYIVTAQKIRIDYSRSGLCVEAEILLADGSIRMIPNVMWDTLSYDNFKTKQAYSDYKKERIV